MKKTKPIGVRVQTDLLNKAKASDPDFNLSAFVRGALTEKYGSVEHQIDEFLKTREAQHANSNL